MRNTDRSNQFSDHDCLEGVLCSSCRLAVNKDTGRLKWCMGGNGIWSARIRYMLLIPTIILPIMIIFIVLSRSNVSSRNILQSTQSNEANRLEVIIDRQRFVSAADDLETATKLTRLNTETSYVPRDNYDLDDTASSSTGGDVSSSSQLTSSYDCDLAILIYQDEMHDYGKRNIDTDFLDVQQELQTGRNYSESGVQNGNENSDESMFEDTTEFEVYDENTEYLNDLDEDEVTDVAQTDTSNFKVNDNSRLAEKEEDVTQGPYNDKKMPDKAFENKTCLTIEGTVADASPDYNSFWKGEGNENSIRKQQVKMMLKYMDKTVNPCEDFYQYACGNWAKHNPIPKYKVGYDTFEMLRESLDLVLKELLEEPIYRKSRILHDNAIIKAKNLYRSCMNHEVLEQQREKPLMKLLDTLGGWPVLKPDWNPDNFDWLVLTAQLRLYNINILIAERIGPLNDIKNSDKYVVQFDETSLGLPTRDYFLQPSYKFFLEAYKNYFIKVVTLLGAPLDTSTICANEIIDFETQLAKITSLTEEKHNTTKLILRMTLGQLQKRIPEVDWHRYLTIVLAREVKPSEPVIIFAFNYIQNLVLLLSKTPPRVVSNYLLWRFVRLRVNNLDDRFQEVKQKFYFILFGREQAPPRWKMCISQVNANMGMAVGSLFVQKYFDENSKNDTLIMMKDLQKSFREILTRTYWIDDETKGLAIQKIDRMLLKIGYPDYIMDQKQLNECYEDVIIDPNKYFENTLEILQYLTRTEQSRVGTPVNKTLWNTPPSVVNAYYSRYKNQIIFPAGMLQPPFYHKFYPKSLNYGGIGAIIGHEITHGFDNKGRLFDQNGNLKRWWKEETINKFQEKAQCLIDQYNHYTVSDVNMQIDGLNTQGENIADNGGIKQAYNAYENWLNTHDDSKETLSGINATSKQLFFLNFAQVWCGLLRPEAMRNRLKTALHSPGKYRVIGTLSNFKKFSQAFKCPLGSPMNPVKKCSIW